MLLAVFSLYGQDIVGSWTGVLSVPDQGMGAAEYTAVFHIKAAGNGFSCTMDSPDQNVFGYPMDTVIYMKPEVTIKNAEHLMQYVANLTEDGTLKGTFTQGEASLELNMTKKEE